MLWKARQSRVLPTFSLPISKQPFSITVCRPAISRSEPWVLSRPSNLSLRLESLVFTRPSFNRCRLSRSASSSPSFHIPVSEQLPVNTGRVYGQALLSGDPAAPFRKNPVGIQLLSAYTRRQVCPNPSLPDVNPENINIARGNLTKKGLLSKLPEPQEPINIDLPKLQGQNIAEHFHNLGVEQSEPFLSLAETLSQSTVLAVPSHFPVVSGWSKYDAEKNTWSQVSYPEGEHMLVFDVEVLYKIHPYPVLATAVSPTAWYSWISPWLLQESEKKEHLISLGPHTTPRVIVGHNISYDRARILEEYQLRGSQNRFLDTMSLHCASQGVSAPQRGLWKQHQSRVATENTARKERREWLVKTIKETEERIANGEIVGVVEHEPALEGAEQFLATPVEGTVKETLNLPQFLAELRFELDDAPIPASTSTGQRLSPEALGDSSEEDGSLSHGWQDVTSMNALDQVFKLHFPDESMDKDQRAAFSSTDPQTIRDNLQALIRYCATDVHATQRIFNIAFPRFRRLCPSPVSFAGQLIMGSSFLPINKTWSSYIINSDAKWSELDMKVKFQLAALAEESREQWIEPPEDWTPGLLTLETARALSCPKEFQNDPDLSQLDWTPRPAKHIRWRALALKQALLEDEKINGEYLGELGEDSISVATTIESPPGVQKRTRKRIIDGRTMPDGVDSLRRSKFIPRLLGLTYHNKPIHYSEEHGFVYEIEETKDTNTESTEIDSSEPLIFNHPNKDVYFSKRVSQGAVFRQMPSSGKKATSILGITSMRSSAMSSALHGTDGAEKVLEALDSKARWETVRKTLIAALDSRGVDVVDYDPMVNLPEFDPAQAIYDVETGAKQREQAFKAEEEDGDEEVVVTNEDLHIPPSASALNANWWPAWYWKLFVPKQGKPSNNMNITVRSQIASHMLRLSWKKHALYRSKEHGWVYRVPNDGTIPEDDPMRGRALYFSAGESAYYQQRADEEARIAENRPYKTTAVINPDVALYEITRATKDLFFKVPHPQGETHRLGRLITKGSAKFFEDETLTSDLALAKEAIQMDMACSYWISVRERVKEQLAIKESDDVPMGFPLETKDNPDELGMIIPQMVVMGTVTRRAVEKTWLTASNAKKNRIGSELKAMVQAPPGYSIVGADVDSEELWIASLLGDAQLGLHGGSPIGWMTLEGTKSQGTDVHSKTAFIVNVTRDGAKVFNYSRIYGAGIKHATRLLMEGQAVQDEEAATKAAEALYASTKGLRVAFNNADFHRFWFGGTESYLFNSIESVARSKLPQTPALKCGITAALRGAFLEKPSDHMTSRINWVVQSSGVDYLHLLIVAVNHICAHYNIDARFLISVHDEIRYLVKDEDKYRATYALQVANLWTRMLFAFQCGMEDLPQGCAFFSAVDVDKVLRKEVDMPCVTPSNPIPIPSGEALHITKTLELTNGSLHADGQPMSIWPSPPSSLPSPVPIPDRPYVQPVSRVKNQDSIWKSFYVNSQACESEEEVYDLWQRMGSPIDPVKVQLERAFRTTRNTAGPKNSDSSDWNRRTAFSKSSKGNFSNWKRNAPSFSGSKPATPSPPLRLVRETRSEQDILMEGYDYWISTQKSYANPSASPLPLSSSESSSASATLKPPLMSFANRQRKPSSAEYAAANSKRSCSQRNGGWKE
ncbi:Mitochondrial DNA polymerase gamma, catalytic subunit [Phaffia rhodozyma]|uniref:Mitochondrial DNA polymerase catalytic subunit n=1 Tax=Phaffia rhodozyma TaxID=264483 RepID=A0A0F7SMQ3_PHARH|nr:Mitochondrial DNA polymerase gamma, catalytic subunit [Phaffia rhodozyma]